MSSPIQHDFSLAARDVKLPRSVMGWKLPTRTSFQEGAVVPIRCIEVLPGDTISGSTSALVRSVTPLFPVMDDSYLDVYYFFVPNRILWKHWEELCGANKLTAWDDTTEWVLPTTGSSQSVVVGSVADYLGYPVGLNGSSLGVNILPWVAYYKIWDDFFRDENVSSPHALVSAFYDLANGGSLPAGYSFGAGMPCLAAKYHDYFTSCLPAPQKGPAVTTPLAGSAAVDTGDGFLYGYLGGNGAFSSGASVVSGVANAGGSHSLVAKIGTSDVYVTTYIDDRLYADLSTATSASINDLRLAFQLQKFLERDARHGTRYTESLRAHFGVTTPDSTLQRPECLGGLHQRLGMSQVEQTAPTTGANLGEVGAYSLTGISSDGQFAKSFGEHGWFIALACVRVKHSYSQGLPRAFTRRRQFDYYWPEFANIGEQPVYKSELYYGATPGEVFGYQEAWADYRSQFPLATGLMRTGVTGSLGEAWTYGDKYTAAPSLNEDFILEDATLMNRTLSVQSSTSNPCMFKGDFMLSLNIARVMPLYSIPGAIDHN